MEELRRRVVVSFVAVLVVVGIGTLGYSLLGEGRWTLAECAYMTLSTVTTLGLEQLAGFEDVTYTREFTMVLLVLGIGTFLYFASSVTAYIFENDLREVFKERRMQKQISSLEGHVVVCGVGSTGSHVVRELRATHMPFVAIDTDLDRLEAIAAEDGDKFLFIQGDATTDAVLLGAGIERAMGLVAALPDDKDNLYVVITAREAAPRLRIVAKGIGTRAPDKLRKAGADSVVSTNQIGGLRLASEVVRPHVVEFLDEILRERDRALRIEEVEVTERSPFAGKSLREARLRDHANALVLAVRGGPGGYHYNPGPDTVLVPGTTLIVLGPIGEMVQLRREIGES